MHLLQTRGAVTRILIAENEDRITSFLEKGLRSHGFSPTVTSDGAEAIRLARSGRFSLLVLDLDLPDGTAVVQELRASGMPLPIVILTAALRVDEEELGTGPSESAVLTKPFAFDELLARIATKLRERSVAPSSRWRRRARHVAAYGDRP
jgi:DNA-binding response OmpR family regulator